VTGPMIIKKAMSFYDEMKITNKCTFSEGNKKITSKNIGQYRYCLIIQHPSGLCGCQIKEVLLYKQLQ
jgi:hypothetical protein